MKILVVSGYHGDCSYGKLFLGQPNIAWAGKIWSYSANYHGDRHPFWQKVGVLRHVFASTATAADLDCDWFMWVDHDTLFANTNWINENAALLNNPTCDMIIARTDTVEGGVFLLRDCYWSRLFVADWWARGEPSTTLWDDCSFDLHVGNPVWDWPRFHPGKPKNGQINRHTWQLAKELCQGNDNTLLEKMFQENVCYLPEHAVQLCGVEGQRFCQKNALLDPDNLPFVVHFPGCPDDVKLTEMRRVAAILPEVYQ